MPISCDEYGKEKENTKKKKVFTIAVRPRGESYSSVVDRDSAQVKILFTILMSLE